MRISIKIYEYDSILLIFLNTHYWSLLWTQYDFSLSKFHTLGHFKKPHMQSSSDSTITTSYQFIARISIIFMLTAIYANLSHGKDQ